MKKVIKYFLGRYFLGRYLANKKKTELGYLPNRVYRICLKSTPIASVDVVIFNNKLNKILLFKRNNNPLEGFYYSIGGRVLKNEYLIDTALRKLRDEAGVDITPEELCFGGFMEEFYENSVYSGVDTHNINIFFSYIFRENDSFKLDCQHSAYKWFDINSKQIHPHIRQKINAIIKKK